MAEYNVQINKYNANNLGYDQLYPQPMKHADTHLLNGSDPINVGELGVSNRNLLDNAYFANPDAIIDQRGGYVVPPNTPYYHLSETDWNQAGTTTGYYKVTGTINGGGADTITVDGTTYMVMTNYKVRGYTGVGYGIDRWKFAISEEDAAVLTIVSDGILITRNKGTSNFFTFVDVPESVIGETFTVSILIDGLGLLSKSFVVTENYKYYYWNGSTPDDGYTTIKYGDSGRKVLAVLFATGNRATTKIKAAKLELGTVQTLAHQDEDGNWVLNDPPPDKGLELAECQRYCFVWDYGNTSTSCLAVFQAYTATNAFGIIPTPVTLRANPVVSGGTLVAGGKTVSLTGITKCANGIRAIAIVSDGNLTVGQAVGIENGNDNGRVVFSADL